MKDIRGEEIHTGDLLLNLQDKWAPFDAWRFLVATWDRWNGHGIRDLNAWNIGWEPKLTFNLGNWTDMKQILDEHEIRLLTDADIEELTEKVK